MDRITNIDSTVLLTKNNSTISEKLGIMSTVATQMCDFRSRLENPRNIFSLLTSQCAENLAKQRETYLFLCSKAGKIFCAVCCLFGVRCSTLTKGADILDYKTLKTKVSQHEKTSGHQNAYKSYIQGLQKENQYNAENVSADLVSEMINTNLFDIVNDKTEGDNGRKYTQKEIMGNRHVIRRVILCALFLISHGRVFYLLSPFAMHCNSFLCVYEYSTVRILSKFVLLL